MKKNYNSPKTNTYKFRIQTSIQDTSIHEDYGDEQYSKTISSEESEEGIKWGDMW